MWYRPHPSCRSLPGPVPAFPIVLSSPIEKLHRSRPYSESNLRGRARALCSLLLLAKTDPPGPYTDHTPQIRSLEWTHQRDWSHHPGTLCMVRQEEHCKVFGLRVDLWYRSSERADTERFECRT